MSGKKGRSGRRTREQALVMKSLGILEASLPAAVKTIVDKAASGDEECARYVVDRVLGRPRIEVESKLRTNVTLDADRLIQRLREIREREAELFATLDRSQPPAVSPPQLREGNAVPLEKDDQNSQIR